MTERERGQKIADEVNETLTPWQRKSNREVSRQLIEKMSDDTHTLKSKNKESQQLANRVNKGQHSQTVSKDGKKEVKQQTR